MPGLALQQTRFSRQPSRLRSARQALLDAKAVSILDPVRDVICEPTRSQIVRVLATGPLSVSDLAATLNRSKAGTSQHLRVLRTRGVVAPRRRGRAVFYSLVPGPLMEATVQVLDTAAALSAG